MAQRGLHAAQDRKCAEGKIPSRRSMEWAPVVISRLLKRQDTTSGSASARRRPSRSSATRDKPRSKPASSTRRGLSLREIDRRLPKLGLVPPRGGEWHAAAVAELFDLPQRGRSSERWRESTPVARRRPQPTPDRRRADVGRPPPAGGGPWHPATVATLISAYQHPPPLLDKPTSHEAIQPLPLV